MSALQLARELRGAVRELLSGIEGRKGLENEPIERINAVMRMGHGHDVVVRDGPHWTVRFVRIEAEPAAALVPIARSIAGIVADRRAPEAVRKCANGGCALYFYDTSRTGQRRWCSMASCGNRAKAAAHVRRTPARGAAGPAIEAAGSKQGTRRGKKLRDRAEVPSLWQRSLILYG